jgi:hypothetical protein
LFTFSRAADPINHAGLKEATVLSQASIAAVSLASIAFNLRKRHPLHPASKTLIDYEMCLTMTPALVRTHAMHASTCNCCL